MFNIDTTRNFFGLLREKFENQRDNLNALDSVIGDGDHGFTVKRAFIAVHEISILDYTDLGAMFDAVSQALAESSGGAIGPLLAAFFAECGTVLAGKNQAEVQDFALFFNNGLVAIEEIGGAVPGEKTLLDALAPAAAYLQTANIKPLGEILILAAQSAWAGAFATKEMQAGHGRAHFLGKRSIGFQDAGATSMAMIIEAFSDAVNGKQSPSYTKTQVDSYKPSKKFINHPDNMVREDNEGLELAYPNFVHLTAQGVLKRVQLKANGKVGLAIGHGGGHTPSMGGFVGTGLLDADVYGPIFTCASGLKIANAVREADHGAGVVLLVSNHSGDVLNARLAVHRLQQEGLRVVPVYLGDDIATASREKYYDRRGLGGLLFALKIGGAAAEAGKSLEEVVALMKKTNERTATLSVASHPPTHPATGLTLFELKKGTIEVGTGVHGEAGIYRGAQMTADSLMDMLLEKLIEDIKVFNEKRLIIFLNGAGGTSKMELHILYRRAHKQLIAAGYTIEGTVIESLFTTQEMGGFSLTLCSSDEEMLEFWRAPAYAPSFYVPFH
jgi:phosphoenolpyruvate---glycerone phosphotransferase subunit DhaK